MSDTITQTAHGVKLSEPAADKVRNLLEQEGRDDLRLRVAVQPGGCSGLIYQLYFDERLLDGDAVVVAQSVPVEHPLVEVELVDQPGAATRLHRDAKAQVVAALLLEQATDLARGDVGDVDAVGPDVRGGVGHVISRSCSTYR